MSARSARPWLLATALSLLAAPAGAVPITYTMQATLAVFGGSDSGWGLDGATYTLVATLDTEDPPDAVFAPGSASWQIPTVYTVSNRPGGLPDIVLAFDTWFDVYNQAPPSSFGDAFGTLEPACILIFCPDPGYGLFAMLVQGAFPGTDYPTPPVWSPGDVVSVEGFIFDGDSFGYDFVDASFTATVPEPATVLLVGGLGLGMAAGARRLRAARAGW